MARKQRAQQPAKAAQAAAQPQRSNPQKRTTEQINHAVLSRYIPGLERIIGVAPFTVLYNFSSESRQWEKCGIEGSMFVCQTWNDNFQGYSVVILNRKSLDNYIVHITSTDQVELDDKYVILQGMEGDAPQIYGVWIFSEEGEVPSTKGRLGKLIWDCAVAAENQTDLTGGGEEDEEEEEAQLDAYTAPAPTVHQHVAHAIDLNTIFSKPQVQDEIHISQIGQAQNSNVHGHGQPGPQLELLNLFGAPQSQQAQYAQQQSFQPPPPPQQYYSSPPPPPPPQQQQQQQPTAGQQNLLSLFKNG